MEHLQREFVSNTDLTVDDAMAKLKDIIEDFPKLWNTNRNLLQNLVFCYTVNFLYYISIPTS